MARQIFKYPVGHGEGASIEMPAGATLLHVGDQAGNVMVWAEVSPEAPLARRQIGYYATGAELPDDAEYVGTVVTRPHGFFVWHVYERPAN